MACGETGAIATIRQFQTSHVCVGPGETATLTWQVERAKACQLQPGLDRLPRKAGSLDVQPAASTDYLLSCDTVDGVEEQSVSVFVTTAASAYEISLAAKYERIPSTPAGLNFDLGNFIPIRAAAFEILDGCDGTSLAVGSLDDSGESTISFNGRNVVQARIFAEIESPPIQVVDNTLGQAIYALDSKKLDLNIHDGNIEVAAGSGWHNETYRQVRAAGPFAILDSAYTAAQAFLAVTDLTFPPLTLNWSVRNRPEPGNPLSGYADGAIGTSFWDGSQLYILGQADVDTDEYDAHVIVHEWGHYFESSFSRADTIGGPHGFGELLDPRVAFSEGWCNALSGIVLSPNSVYTDSYGSNQLQSSAFDLNDNSDYIDPIPGWFSESSVQAIVFDLFDDDENEAWDELSFELLTMFNVLAGPQKSTPAMTTLFSFIHGLKTELANAFDDSIDLLLDYHAIAPITDEWGSGETNSGAIVAELGGIAENLPVYNQADIGDTVELTFAGGEFAGEGNKLGQHRYVRFQGTGQLIRITSDSEQDLGLYLYRRGTVISSADVTLRGKETLVFSSEVDTTYILNIVGFRTSPGDYTGSVTIEP